jgi:hypothetical protein
VIYTWVSPLFEAVFHLGDSDLQDLSMICSLRDPIPGFVEGGEEPGQNGGSLRCCWGGFIEEIHHKMNLISGVIPWNSSRGGLGGGGFSGHVLTKTVHKNTSQSAWVLN